MIYCDIFWDFSQPEAGAFLGAFLVVWGSHISEGTIWGIFAFNLAGLGVHVGLQYVLDICGT